MEEYAVMTCNLLTDHLFLTDTQRFSKRAQAIQEMIQQLHPDLIGLQEMTKTMFPYLSEVFKEYGLFGDSRHSMTNDEYCLILYRKDRFDLLGGSTLWLSHTPEKAGSKLAASIYPRIVTFGYFKDRQTEDFFTFANTHLDHGLAGVRNEQAAILARILLERQKGSHLFVTGDFNTTQNSDALHLFQKTHLRDAVKDELGSTLRGRIGSTRYHSHPIDHIYISRDMSILNVRRITARYHGIAPSDHYPVIAYIAL